MDVYIPRPKGAAAFIIAVIIMLLAFAIVLRWEAGVKPAADAYEALPRP